MAALHSTDFFPKGRVHIRSSDHSGIEQRVKCVFCLGAAATPKVDLVNLGQVHNLSNALSRVIYQKLSGDIAARFAIEVGNHNSSVENVNRFSLYSNA